MPESDAAILRALFDRLDLAVLIADDRGALLDANGAGCRLLGCGREDLAGRRIADFVAVDEQEALRGQWEAFLREGEQSGRVELRMADGKRRWARFSAYANVAPGRHVSVISLEPEGVDQPASGEFITICSWTKRVKDGAHWVPIDTYLQRVFGIWVSHGISPEAMEEG